jgi:signal transduction histidine kinase
VALDELVLRTVAAHNQTIPVRISPQATGLEVRADKQRLQRAIANLLTNADVHAGGPVLVTLDYDKPWAKIGVEDQGPGVASSEHERVFERFYRGAASGRRGSTTGTGLGLALVAEHARAHDGTVHIENNVNGGARFTIMLPASEPR